MTRDNLEETLQSIPSLLDDIVGEAVGEYLYAIISALTRTDEQDGAWML